MKLTPDSGRCLQDITKTNGSNEAPYIYALASEAEDKSRQLTRCLTSSLFVRVQLDRCVAGMGPSPELGERQRTWFKIRYAASTFPGHDPAVLHRFISPPCFPRTIWQICLLSKHRCLRERPQREREIEGVRLGGAPENGGFVLHKGEERKRASRQTGLPHLLSPI